MCMYIHVFQDRFPGSFGAYPGSRSVPPGFASLVLGLKACTTGWLENIFMWKSREKTQEYRHMWKWLSLASLCLRFFCNIKKYILHVKMCWTFYLRFSGCFPFSEPRQLVRVPLCPQVVSVESCSAGDTLAGISVVCAPAPTDRDTSEWRGDLKSRL